MSGTSPELRTKIYRAGAGAGKTTSLIGEVYDFYKHHRASHKRCPRVVLTTFTRKATQEMRERLMLKAQELKDDEFLEFVLSKNNLHISTIHGVLQIFLKQYGHMIDLDPGFSISSSNDTFRSASQIMKTILVSEERFQNVLDHFEFKSLVQNGLRFFEHFMINSNLTAPQMINFQIVMESVFNELTTEVQFAADDILKQTDDVKYVEAANHLLKLKPILNVSNWMERREEILNHIDEISIPRKNPKNPKVSEESHDKMKSVEKALRELEDPLYSPITWAHQVESHLKLEQLFKVFHGRFLEHKCNSGELQMSDLEIFSHALLKSKPEALTDFSKQWDYWLIDEFQDTSPLQVSILENLIRATPHFIVGDPQQSIYFFRGARQEVFFNKQKQIESKMGILKNLSVNYRANPNLLLFKNEMFRSLGFMPMTTTKTASLTADPAALIVSNGDQIQEIQSIASYISDLIQQGVRCEEISVISRKNSDLALIAAALETNGIPYFLHAAAGFGGRREILDALALLKFLVHPFDNENLVTLLRSPWFHIPDDVLASFLKDNEYFWYLLLKEFEEHPDKLESVGRLKLLVEYSKSAGISRAFEKGLFSSGLLDKSFQYDPSGRREANIWKLLVQLRTEEHRAGFNYVNFIKNFDKADDASDDQSDAVSSIEPNRVNLMTVHVSKGLEFQYVILPFISKSQQIRPPKIVISEGCWNIPTKTIENPKQVLPLSARLELQKIQEEELAENKRLLYVAATRAKNQLFFSYSGEAKKNSWLSYLSFDLSVGMHEREGYRYLVTDGYTGRVRIDKNDSRIETPRPLFQNPATWILNASKQSVTQLVETDSITSIETILQSLKKSEQGIQIHRLFELIHYEGEQEALDIAKSWSEETFTTFSKALQFVKRQTSVPLLKLVETGNVEWGFIVKGDERDIEGQVDLWGIYNEEVWIVDYKTGNPNFKEKAFKQLELYSLAVQKFVGPRKVNLCAIFPNHEAVEVRQSPTLKDLEKKFI